jgi:release factor glutamine methyltransferase
MVMTDSEHVTWRELWAQTTSALGDRHHARWMCEVASGCDGPEFLAELDEPAMHGMVAHLDAMLARRAAGEPLQYVLGRWQFRRLDLMVDQRVLIPRPETEWVCEAAIELARSLRTAEDAGERLLIADLGTGSGAIGLSLAAELPVDSAQVWLADVSSDAVDVASANLAGIGRNAQSVRIVQGSWFLALPSDLRGRLDLVVANPPYIALDDPDVEAHVAEWEPHLALFGGVDGLRDIRVLVADAAAWLRPGGYLVLEIGADQGAAVIELLNKAGLADAEIRSDLAGRDRIAVARR